MVSNVDAKMSKKSKKKGQSRAELCDKVTSNESKKLSIRKQQSSGDSKKSVLNYHSDNIIVSKSVNKEVNKTCDYLNPSTSSDPRYNNEVEVDSNNSKQKSDPEKNRGSLIIRRPSQSGSTMWVAKLDRKYKRKNYKRKLHHYETLVKILINARSEDLSNYNIIQHGLRVLNGNRDRSAESGNIRSTESGDKANRKITAIENYAENTGLSNNEKGIGELENSKAKLDARKPIEISKTGDKIYEKNVTASTSKYLDNFDDHVSSIEKNYEIIPSERRINECPENETYLQKFLDPYELDDSDVVAIEEIISGIAKSTTGPVNYGSSRKKDLQSAVKGTRLEDKPSNVNIDGKLSPKFGKHEASSKYRKKHDKKRSSRRNSESGNSVICINGQSKGEKTSNKGSKTSSVKEKIGEKISKDETMRNSNQSKSNLGSKHAGRYCTCKYKKLRDVKTSAYAIPAEIECPNSSNIRRGYGKRSTVKSGRNIPDADASGRIFSPLSEKKTKKFYSPLELKYSQTTRSRLDPEHVSKNLHNLPKGSADKVSLKKFPNKFSISNFTLPLDIGEKNDNPEAKLIDNREINSNSSKLPTFSNYSIPVSIEINMAKNKLRKRSLSLNLIQSKITRYFQPIRVQNDCNSTRKTVPTVQISNLNSSNECAGENLNRIDRINSRLESRSLPMIESDILLKNTDKVIYLKSLYCTVRKPESKISHRKYLYDNDELLVNETTTSNQNQNQNQKDVIFEKNNIRSPIESDDSIDLRIIADSNNSANESVIPASYSIFSNNDDEDQNRPIIDMNKILDTQQREDLLAPWETVNIYEKIDRWQEDAFE